jgi:hypothetical protein
VLCLHVQASRPSLDHPPVQDSHASYAVWRRRVRTSTHLADVAVFTLASPRFIEPGVDPADQHAAVAAPRPKL